MQLGLGDWGSFHDLDLTTCVRVLGNIRKMWKFINYYVTALRENR
jgi:hypothetical protein